MHKYGIATPVLQYQRTNVSAIHVRNTTLHSLIDCDRIVSLSQYAYMMQQALPVRLCIILAAQCLTNALAVHLVLIVHLYNKY